MSDELNLDDFNVEDLWWNYEWLRCAPDSEDPEELLAGFIYFCETYWYIRHPDRGRILFELFDAQIETVRSWLNTRYSLILKARQIGFSTLVAAYSFWSAYFYSDRPILMLSRTEREAIKLLGKAKYGKQFLPLWMKDGLPRAPHVNETMTKMEFSNASYIESLPSASDPARGESAYLVIVDEIAFLPNSEEAWSAIEPVADVGGRVILLSTAKGEGNLFHRLWVEAEDGRNRFTPLFFPWSANGRDEDWYRAKAQDTPDYLMAQEYPSTPEEAFLKSGRPVFSLEVLNSKFVREPLFEGDIVGGQLEGAWNHDGAWDQMPNRQTKAPLRIWHLPEDDGKYVIGADPSQGLAHSDYASVHLLDARTGALVATWHGLIDPDLLATVVLAPLGKMFNKALIGVESNNHGLTTLKALRKVGYFPIYHERSPQYKRSVPTDILGFRTTQVTKPLMIDELAKALRDGMDLPDKYTIGELKTFARDDKGKMAGQPFDDRTISLAIANQMIKYVWFDEFQPEKEIVPGSWGDWQKRTYGSTMSELLEGRKNQERKARQPIGSFAIRSPRR